MDERLRTLIVDDEPAARTRLCLLCAALPRLEVVAAAANAQEALDVLARDPVDLLLLDIEMPGMDGMALARILAERPNPPAVVFVTAFDRFAVAAFGVNAVGYLLKPVDPDLLAQTVDRIHGDLRTTPAAAYLDSFWAPLRGELLRIPASDVEWIGGEGDYVRLHVGSRSYLVSERLYDLETRLPPERFVRVHRSAIVQAAQVIALRHAGGGAWMLGMAGGATVPVGRTFLDVVRRRLDAR